MVKDPICGMMVDEKKTKFKSEYNGKTYYFCASSCKVTFDKSPAKYADNVDTTGHSCNCGHDHC